MRRPLRATAAVLAFALGALARRRGRSAAAALVLALVVAALGSVAALTASLREEAGRTMAALPELTVSRLRGGRPALLTAADVARVAGVRGVAAARPRVWGYLFVEGLNANLVIVGVPPGEVPALFAAAGVRRARPADGADAPAWVVLGEGARRALGVRPGDVIGLHPPEGSALDVEVVGALRGAAALTTADTALLAEDAARRLLGLAADEATDVAATVAPDARPAAVAAAVRAALPGVRAVARAELAGAYDETYDLRGGLGALLLLPALLALGVLCWDRATRLSVDERRESAVLRAVGWSRGQLALARLAESAALAAGAAAAGALAAYGYVFALGAPGLLGALLGWSALEPAFRPTPPAHGAPLALAAAAAALPYLLAAAVPALRAANLDPAEAAG